MIGRLKALLTRRESYRASADDPEARKRLAVAALLVELARADFDESSAEHHAIGGMLARHFDISAAEASNLLNNAQLAADEAVSLYDFTRALHETLTSAEKQQVIAMLWQVALADSTLDKYEDFLVGKIADLLYVSRSEVMFLKNQAQLDKQ